MESARRPAPKRDMPTRSAGSNRKFIAVGIAVLCVVLLVFGIRACSANSADITESTVKRAPITGVSNAVGYFRDEDGSFVTNPDKLNTGMEKFFKETGVHPYVVVLRAGTETTLGSLQECSELVYGELFGDEQGHFVIVYCEDGQGGFDCGYLVGKNATRVMDDEALEIFNDYMSYYHKHVKASDEALALAFTSTSHRIMTVGKETGSIVFAAILMSGMVILSVVVFLIVHRRSRRESGIR